METGARGDRDRLVTGQKENVLPVPGRFSRGA
jgi:hypothetical protein